MPWDCIINLITTLALIGGTTFAFWSLTEDNAVLAIPVLQLVGPFLLTKIQEKTWLDAKQVHLGNELLTTAVLGKKNMPLIFHFTKKILCHEIMIFSWESILQIGVKYASNKYD